MTEIVLVSINRMGMNGDRATTKTAYKAYEIHAREPGGELNKDTMLEEFPGYDSWNSHILDQRRTADEAFQKARKLAKLITGSEQNLIQEYGMTIEEARKSAMQKLTRRERQALGFE